MGIVWVCLRHFEDVQVGNAVFQGRPLSISRVAIGVDPSCQLCRTTIWQELMSDEPWGVTPEGPAA